MIHSGHSESNGSVQSHEAPAARNGSPETVRIRKYPNRRLYDTSRSRHVTQQEVLDLVLAGRRVEVTDSRSNADITNAVLLQILIDRDADRIAKLPAGLVHWAARAGHDELVSVANQSMQSAVTARRPAPSPVMTSRPQPTIDSQPRSFDGTPRLKAQKIVR
jgi:polyhydroxyalkanoate synthesis repressor PhaR